MKKKILVLTVMLLICCLLPCQAFAAGYVNFDLPLPNEALNGFGADAFGGYGPDVFGGFGSLNISTQVSTPVIINEPYAFSAARGDVPGALCVEASSYDNGFLGYQWYMSYSGSYNDLFAVDGACASTYTPAQILGTVYYCAGVYNVVGDLRSEEVMTGFVPVSHFGIEITKAPDKYNYTVGSGVDLSGLVVTVYDEYSGSWQSVNGSGLNVYPSVLNSVGQAAVQVSYNGSSDVFYVNVARDNGNKTVKNSDGTVTVVSEDGTVTTVAADGAHVHSFGEWEVTLPATCVTTGMQTRTCECGESETEEIPRTDHTWDEGTVTKEPTETSNGARLYTCTICKASKSEIIDPLPKTVSTAAVEAQAASLNINGGDPDKVNTVPGSQGAVTGTTRTGTNGEGNVAAGKVNSKDDGSGWWLIPASALVLVVTGTGAYYLMRKKGGQE